MRATKGLLVDICTRCPRCRIDEHTLYEQIEHAVSSRTTRSIKAVRVGAPSERTKAVGWPYGALAKGAGEAAHAPSGRRADDWPMKAEGDVR